MSAATKDAGSSPGSAVDVASRLALVAAPAFALMAGISVAGSPGMAICSTSPALVPINDMALMYLLMSFFHLPPWLKLLSARSQPRDTIITQAEGD